MGSTSGEFWNVSEEGEGIFKGEINHSTKVVNYVGDPTPNYYRRWKMDPVTFCVINNLPFTVGNVIKYVMRFDMKDGLEDLKKARRYIDIMIEDKYGKNNV